jgi:hypothetical protein
MNREYNLWVIRWSPNVRKDLVGKVKKYIINQLTDEEMNHQRNMYNGGSDVYGRDSTVIFPVNNINEENIQHERAVRYLDYLNRAQQAAMEFEKTLSF